MENERNDGAADGGQNTGGGQNARGAQRGIFWIADSENLQNNLPYIFRLPAEGGITADGVYPPPNAKRGNGYNHALTWQYLPQTLRGGKPYNYYPRGRVKPDGRGGAKIFLNPCIATEQIIEFIIAQFCLDGLKIRVIADGSAHYRARRDGYV